MVQRIVDETDPAIEIRQLGLLDDAELCQLGNPDSLRIFTQTLSTKFSNYPLTAEQSRTWELVGVIYRRFGRNAEASSIFKALYDRMLGDQEATGIRIHKGMPLVWLSDCYLDIGYSLTALRFLMLTLIEDAISGQGAISPEKTGVYWRLVFRGWLSESEMRRYAIRAYKISAASATESMFPEWVLQKLDRDWVTWAPTPQEAGVYIANVRYVRFLANRLGDGTGKPLEYLADYLLSSMPGCRTALRQRTYSTDYDVVCAVEGLENDFRSELGRYFIAECKDWTKSVDFTTFAKLCRVLDSTKARFGILFSKSGISGTGRRQHAELEQIKVYQDRGIVIIAFDEPDLERVILGANFISMLRTKYERVRLGLVVGKPPTRPTPRSS